VNGFINYNIVSCSKLVTNRFIAKPCPSRYEIMCVFIDNDLAAFDSKIFFFLFFAQIFQNELNGINW
jgi:hypothetical protein